MKTEYTLEQTNLQNGKRAEFTDAHYGLRAEEILERLVGIIKGSLDRNLLLKITDAKGSGLLIEVTEAEDNDIRDLEDLVL